MSITTEAGRIGPFVWINSMDVYVHIDHGSAGACKVKTVPMRIWGGWGWFDGGWAVAPTIKVEAVS